MVVEGEGEGDGVRGAGGDIVLDIILDEELSVYQI